MRHLAPHCTRVTLSRNDVISRPSHPIRSALFVETGVASVVKHDGRQERIEICLVGREGFCGTPLLTGDGCWPYQTFVQADDLTAIELDADALTAFAASDAAFREVLLHAVHVQMVQIAEGLVSAAWQRLPVRLARWLLMYRDRIGTDRLELTHEFIALMVGAQRTGITAALHELEGEGLIAAMRGRIIVRDADGLEAFADGGYGTAEHEQRRLLVAANA